ncbi:Carbamoyl-phosphate synthase arginine-specific small chain [bioreactor metagenome]|uniref:Carbamoyl-phosphate synthase arginine-specific small chain n=1 Tax=bioreactor metagenome TaxID=1076179 RepID=A0A645EAX2_9ZZZZ
MIYNLGGAAREAEAMTTRNMRVTVVPRTYSAQMICALNPYGIIISDGSEAAGISDSLKNNIKEIIELKINTIAVGFGHIICAAALGAETEELNSGHRGQNYSVLCPVKSRIYVTDQNHGYTVKNNSIPRLVGEITQINLSDLTPEAIRYRGYPLETVQYRPDNTSNEHTTGWIYDEFTAKCKGDI